MTVRAVLRAFFTTQVPDPEPGSFREFLCHKQGIATRRDLDRCGRHAEERFPSAWNGRTHRDKPRYVDPPTVVVDVDAVTEKLTIVDGWGAVVAVQDVNPQRVRPYVAGVQSS